MKFYFDEEVKDILIDYTHDLMCLSNIPTLEMGRNVFWQMISIDCEKEALKRADKFFKDTFGDLYETDSIVTIIRFKWKMSNMYEEEDVLVYFMMAPDELKKKLNSVLKMKAFW